MDQPTQDVKSQIDQSLLNLPAEFQAWCQQKKLKGRDLRPLLSLKSSSEINSLLTKIVEYRASKSVGCQLLEWLVELTLLGQTGLDPQPLESLQCWYMRLRGLRYPSSSSLEQSMNDYVQKLKWPDDTRCKWVRRGDKTGLELTLFSGSIEDFDKKVSLIRQKFSALSSSENQ